MDGVKHTGSVKISRTVGFYPNVIFMCIKCNIITDCGNLAA